jgi:thioredoxin reductase (NADPH)
MNQERSYDLVIVGAGPAGLSAACTAAECGLSHIVLERGVIAQTIFDYPIAKPLHSPASDVEFRWGELFSRSPSPSREDVLAYYNRFCVQAERLNVRTHEAVETITRSAAGFVVQTPRGRYAGRNLLLATGGFGIPRRLKVPGDTPERVQYRFVEGFPYAGKSVLVVGGGNSAVECALYLHEASAKVTYSLRRPSLAPRDKEADTYTTIKPWVRAPLEALAGRGEIQVIYRSHVVEITEDAALLRVEGQDELLRVPCDQVFALLGADPDLQLLKEVDAEIAADGRPVYNRDTYETTVPGCYVAGHLTRELHMRNAVVIPPRIVRGIARQGEDRRPPAWTAPIMRTIDALRFKSLFTRRVLKRFPAVRRFVQGFAPRDMVIYGPGGSLGP